MNGTPFMLGCATGQCVAAGDVLLMLHISALSVHTHSHARTQACTYTHYLSPPSPSPLSLSSLLSTDERAVTLSNLIAIASLDSDSEIIRWATERQTDTQTTCLVYVNFFKVKKTLRTKRTIRQQTGMLYGIVRNPLNPCQTHHGSRNCQAFTLSR